MMRGKAGCGLKNERCPDWSNSYQKLEIAGTVASINFGRPWSSIAPVCCNNILHQMYLKHDGKPMMSPLLFFVLKTYCIIRWNMAVIDEPIVGPLLPPSGLKTHESICLGT